MNEAAAKARTVSASVQSAPDASNYRPDIDGLRAIAVLGVVLYHFGAPGLPGGFLGVDVFFVISGYLIVGLIRREVEETGAFRFRHFYLRRVRRLFPALAATMLLAAAAAVVILSPPHLEQFGQELIAATLSVSNIYFKAQVGYFDIDSQFKALLHTWSLSVEEQFYLFAPLLCVRVMRWGKDRLLFLLAGLSVITLILAELQHGRMSAFYLAPFRIFEFSFGALLLWLPERWPRSRPAQEGIFVLGLVLVASSFHFLTTESRLPGLATMLPVGGALLAIQAGRAPSSGWLVRNPLSVGIGRISYSLYLVHWPILILAAYLTFDPLTAAQRALLFGLSMVLAVLLHLLVERPLRRPRTSAEGGNHSFLRAAAAVALGCVLLGGAMALGGGWTWRLSPEGAKLAASPGRPIALQDECQYVQEQIDDALQTKFDACAKKRGPSVIVFGDSHAADLFDAMSVNGARLHVTGISQPTCRPNAMRAKCFYPRLGAFIARNRSHVAGLVFTERGSSFLSDGEALPVRSEDIETVIAYLESLRASGIPLLWAGPQAEPLFPVEKFPAMLKSYAAPDFLASEITLVDQVDRALAETISARNGPLTYVSKLDLIGPIAAGSFIVDGEFTYSDDDHWSAKGEEIFGAKMLAGSPALRALFGDRRAGLSPARGG